MEDLPDSPHAFISFAKLHSLFLLMRQVSASKVIRGVCAILQHVNQLQSLHLALVLSKSLALGLCVNDPILK